MTAYHVPDFDITIDSREGVVAVRGEVDRLTAPTLRAGLGLLVDLGHPDVVLDLGALAFMDASGLGVIADTATRLARSGRVLTVRAAPVQTRRLLAICGMNEIVRLEATRNIAAPVVESATADLSADLTHVGSRSNAVIDAALRIVTLLARATVEGADGVSVTLERNGRLATVASSNDTVLRMDQHQYATAEGPCLAAAAGGHSILSESLREEKRWPAFVPLALDEGIASILSNPLMTADRSLGALNIYSNTDRAFGPRQQEVAALFASQASGILAGAGEITEEQMTKRIADALVARETIAQAQGMIMAREQITADDAASRLHRSARRAGVPVLPHATEIVASAFNPDGPHT